MGSDPEATFIAEIALSMLHDIRHALAQLNSAAELAINVARREVQAASGDDAHAAEADGRIHAHLVQMWDRQRDVEALLECGRLLAGAREGSRPTLQSHRLSHILEQAVVVAGRAPWLQDGGGFSIGKTCRDAGVLECDAGLLAQAFANILLDAATYGRRDDPKGSAYARVMCEQQSDHMLVAITHLGWAIAEDEREAIFLRPERDAAEGGRRIAARRRHFGLFIARRIFEQHGGTIVCASSRRMTDGPTPTSGELYENVFEVRLPRVDRRPGSEMPATP